ncbi:hypothetical protein [Streptomyces sp. S186]|uniref:hypothetical protein n=1 Tax=Streptomyces sp. S186 TaxID=3434395 RepID=UPI003F66E7CC
MTDSDGLAEEWRQTKLALARPQIQARLRRLLELGSQTRGPAELDHARFLGEL